MATSGKGKRYQGKAGASGKKKKKPQRGMGVAQLERLREEDHRKKMRTELPLLPLSPPPLPSFSGNIVPSLPFRPSCYYWLRDRIYGDAPAVKMDGRGSVGFAAGGSSQRGFSDGSGCLWGRVGFGCGQLQLLLDPIFGNLLVGSPDPRFPHMEEALEASNELSSKPEMMQCFVDDRGYGSKEKRSIDAAELPPPVAVEGVAQINGGYDFLGLNLGERANESMDEFLSQQCFGPRRKPTVGEEEKAVHRNGRTTVTDRGIVVMEYEFFPVAAPESCGGGGRRNVSYEKEMELMMGHEVQMSQESVEASLITIDDLSLKL